MIAAALYAQILADSALLPLPYKPMMFDAGGLVPVDVELPRPRAVRTERAAEAVSENAAPVIAPAGISDETGREGDPVLSTNGPIDGAASGPPSAIEGTGSLEAVLDAQGRVESVRVLRSIPLLDQAARWMRCSYWRFTPALLNGEPVPVVMTVTVNFELRE